MKEKLLFPFFSRSAVWEINTARLLSMRMSEGIFSINNAPTVETVAPPRTKTRGMMLPSATSV